MQTIAIINQKGGVGKTTTAVTLADGLARQGYQVLLVDLDAQGNVADALGLEKGDGVYEWLVGEADAVFATGRDRLRVILGGKRTVEAREILAGRPFREYAVREGLNRLEGYDVAVLDAAPGIDSLQIGALVACTAFLIPVALDYLAVVGAADMLASAASLTRMSGLGGRLLGVLPTMWERTTRESHEQLTQLVEQYGRLVWPPIPLDVKAREAPAFGKTLWEYAPGCRALDGVEISGRMVGGYRQVLERLVEEMGR